MTFQGTVTVRKALQMSLNVPARRGARQGGGRPVCGAPAPGRRGARTAERRSAGTCHGPRRRRRRLSDLVMLYAGLARLGTTVPLNERLGDTGSPAAATATPTSATADASGERRLMEPVAAWYVGNVLLGTPPPENAPAGRHRLQDRHELWLSRCLVGGLRRQAHHRRVGRPARWRAGAGPGRAHRRGADPVRCLRALRQAAGAAAARAPGVLVATNARLPPPLQRFRAGRSHRCGAAQPRCGSCFRPMARGSN